MRRSATFGLVLVGLMQVFFAATGGDRGFPYREVQALSAVATFAMAWGVWRDTPLPVAIGAGVNTVTRILQPVLGLTRIPVWTNAVLALGWAWMAYDASRGRAPRAGAWVLAVAHFVAALTAEARLQAFVALLVGAVGFFLVAPGLRPRAGTA